MEPFLTEEQREELLSELRLEKNRKFADRIRVINDYYIGRSAYLSPEEQSKLTLELESKVYPTTKSVISHIKKEFGVVYTVGGMTTLLHNLEFSYKKPKGVPGKAKTEEQEAFLEEYTEVKDKGLVYFADSMHPMLNPILSSGWIRRGREFEVKTNSGRQRVNINGAIEMKSLTVVSRSCKRVKKKIDVWIVPKKWTENLKIQTRSV